jgi:hypothetical protein
MRPPSLERRPATTAVVRGYLRASKAAWLFCIGPPETPCRSGANAATRRRTCYAALSQSIPTSDRWRFPLLELSPGYSWQPGLFRSCGPLTLAVFALRRKTSDPLRSDRSPIRVRTLGDRGRMGLRPPSWPGHETGRKRGRPVGPRSKAPGGAIRNIGQITRRLAILTAIRRASVRLSRSGKISGSSCGDDLGDTR